MKTAKFKIGDRVRMGNHEGVVSDAFASQLTGWIYEFVSDTNMTFFAQEDELEMVPEKKEYSMDIKIDIASNVVIATLYENTNGDIAAVIGRGHGHIMHDAELGIAQAASYACKRLYEKLGGFSK